MNALKTRYSIIIAFNVLLVGLWFGVRGNYGGIHFAKNTSSESLSKQNTALKSDAAEQDNSQEAVDIPAKSAIEITRTDTLVRDTEKTVSSIVPIKQDQPMLSLQNTLVVQEVPFLVQAPFGEWNKAAFQHACEEAAMTMAMAWVKGESLSPQQGKQTIESITKFETKKFGKFVFDTSLQDTMEVMKEYFQYDTVEMKQNIRITDIRSALEIGAIVIVPANGRALHNPYFTAPGPAEHMLVISGYDPEAKAFIVHDPGTKNGAGYRYDESVLYEAIRDYMTGNHVPVKDIRKSMIVVRK
ncbi:MAG: C39 family peptidase [Candidatus Moranbacteria bacterium]|nr:C39 family peptidase [Candidatus Moranbacteria bacterium]